MFPQKAAICSTLRTCVRLYGLNKAELNGSRAEVVEVDVPAGRYLVHLQNGKQIKAGTQWEVHLQNGCWFLDVFWDFGKI